MNLTWSSSDWVKLGLAWYIMDVSSKKREKLYIICEHLHDEMQEEMDKSINNMEPSIRTDKLVMHMI